MFTSRLSVGQFSILSYTVNTAVIGSGAAGLNAAVRLADYGQSDIALVTEGMGLGTSRNTGSDKQTYFRLMQAGDTPDSVEQMTKALMDGGSMDGDIALCEAALSAQCFYHLVELGVKFPCSRYGEFVSYKTDHDVCSRGTSCGPYTSRDMTLALEKAVKEREIPILDNLQCIRILRGGDVKVLEGESLPLGILDSLRPTVFSDRTEDGDMLIFMSDGITTAFDSTPELVEFLRPLRPLNPQNLADMLLSGALARTKGRAEDDMTVLCTRIFSAESKEERQYDVPTT